MSKFTLKKLADQVVVITGASSGIGLATARMAAERGAKLVLAARSGDALQELVDEINAAGKGRAIAVVADVSYEGDVQSIAQTAIREYGGFDTWVNNAGIGMYGKIMEIPVEEMRKLYDTNLWGLVYGSRIAVEHLKYKEAGALINVGSIVSDRAIPLQGVYSSTKHAVKGITDALRMELEADDLPISVTLIKPGPIDTPFPMNAKNYLETEPQHVPPVYDPRTVADAILHAAEHPIRDVFVGGGGKSIADLGNANPSLTDKLMQWFVIPGQKSDKPPFPRDESALDRPSERLSERGDYPGHVKPISLYTQAALHPMAVGAIAAGVGFVVAAIWKIVTSSDNGSSAPGPRTAPYPLTNGSAYEVPNIATARGTGAYDTYTRSFVLNETERYDAAAATPPSSAPITATTSYDIQPTTVATPASSM